MVLTTFLHILLVILTVWGICALAFLVFFVCFAVWVVRKLIKRDNGLLRKALELF